MGTRASPRRGPIFVLAKSFAASSIIALQRDAWASDGDGGSSSSSIPAILISSSAVRVCRSFAIILIGVGGGAGRLDWIECGRLGARFSLVTTSGLNGWTPVLQNAASMLSDVRALR